MMRRERRGCSGEDNCQRGARRSPLHSFVTVSVSFREGSVQDVLVSDVCGPVTVLRDLDGCSAPNQTLVSEETV